MKKVVIYIIMALALGLIVFNAFKINSDAWLEGDSAVAIISILASGIVILLMAILLTSIKIQEKKGS